MFGSKPIAAALAALLVLGSVVPATAVAADGSARATVHVEVTQNAMILTVESDGKVMSNATVDVASMGTASYGGEGSYQTGADGEVVLPAPEGEATVEVGVESESVDGDAAVDLTAPESGAHEATLTVESESRTDVWAQVDAWVPVDIEVQTLVEADDGGGSDGEAIMTVETGSDTGTMIAIDGDSGGDGSDSDVTAEADVDSDATVEAGLEADVVSDTGNDPEADSDTDAGSESEAGSDGESDAQGEADSGSESSGDTETDSESQTQAESDSGADTEVDSDDETTVDSDSESSTSVEA